MKVGERATFEVGTTAGVWGVEGDAVTPTTPTAGRARLEVRAVRPGTATVHFSHRDSAVPRREFPVAVEGEPKPERATPGLRCQMHGDFEGVFCPECHAEEAARERAEAARREEEERQRLAEAAAQASAASDSQPSPSDDARTLRNSQPGPEDDEEVRAAALRMRERRDEDETPLESESSN